jgi:hypothetical protein
VFELKETTRSSVAPALPWILWRRRRILSRKSGNCEGNGEVVGPKVEKDGLLSSHKTAVQYLGGCWCGGFITVLVEYLIQKL